MRNMKTKMKLVMSFCIVSILTGAVGLVGILGLLSINENEDTLYRITLNGVTATELVATLREQQVMFRDAVLNMENPTKLNEIYTAWDQLDKEFSSSVSTLKGNLLTEQGKKYIGEVEAASGKYAESKTALKNAVATHDFDTANGVLADAATSINVLVTALENTRDYANEVAGNTNKSDSDVAYMLVWVLILLALVALSVSTFFTSYISNLISRPIKCLRGILYKMGIQGIIDFSPEEYAEAERYATAKDEIGESIKLLIATARHIETVGKALQTISNGDLTINISPLSNDDALVNSLSKMLDNLNNMFSDINNSAEQVAAASKQISDGAQSLAQGTTEQASSTEQLSSSIAQVAVQTNENANMAKNASKLAESIRQKAEKGSEQMEHMTAAVREINEASQSIGKIIKVIDDIAFQTNILALNAAVEAARAGQHGKGFAVVAEEVRNLAAKSAEAAKSTSEIIEASVHKAEMGVDIADQTSASLSEIVAGINESNKIVGDIASSSETQSRAISQINQGIDQVTQVVQTNSATAEQSAAASQEMRGQSDMLQRLVEQFKLRDSRSRNIDMGNNLAAPPRIALESSTTGYTEFGKY